MSESHSVVKVWDLPTRLCHWLLALSVLGCYGTAEWGWLTMQWHFYFGYAVLVLCLFRILWGFVGGEHARFVNFIRGPASVLRYLKGQAPHQLGHNPLGALSVVAMLGALLAQSISGLFNNDEIEWYGPLSERVSYKVSEWMADYHERADDFVLILIGVHLIAVFSYLLLKRVNLISPMLSGNKMRQSAADQDAKFTPWWLALLCLALSAGFLWAVIRFWPQPALVY